MAGNEYYPLIKGPDGQVYQSPNPQPMPNASDVDKMENQKAAAERAKNARLTAPRNPAPNPQVQRVKGAIGIPFKRGK